MNNSQDFWSDHNSKLGFNLGRVLDWLLDHKKSNLSISDTNQLMVKKSKLLFAK